MTATEHPRLSRAEAWEIVCDMEDDLTNLKSLAAATYLMVVGLEAANDIEEADAAAFLCVGYEISKRIEATEARRTKLFHGLHASHDHDRPAA